MIAKPVLAVLLLLTFPVCAVVTVQDDSGSSVVLPAPAQRIISLSPHTTELLYTAGAGDRLVAAVKYSDYPAAAQMLPRVGDAFNIDIEQVLLLQPDLLVGWLSGNGQQIIEQLRSLGLVLYVSEPRSLRGLARSIGDFGLLAGTGEQAERASRDYLSQLATLERANRGKRPVTVFYQTWREPVFTVNEDHLISHVVSLCGGRNIFSGLGALSAQISVEDVLLNNPDVILASSTPEDKHTVLSRWDNWPQLNAVKNGHLYTVPSEYIVRHSVRILRGAEIICRLLDAARAS